METKTNYTIVGLIVLILLGGLIAMGLWLSVGFDQKQYRLYAVYIHEAVSGLSEESQVKYNGVKVGFVKKIALNRLDPQQVKILLSIEEGIPITTSTTATLISQGITGTTYVGLSATSSDLTPLKKLPKEPYPIIPTKPSLFHQLDRVLKEVSENVNKVSLEISRIFDRENAKYIKETLEHLKTFSEVISQNSQHIDHGIANADILLKNLAEVSHDLPQVVKDLKIGAHKLNGMTTAITTAGNKVSSAVSPTIVLLHRLNTIAANLEKVSVQMRQNPAVVIRGTTPPQPGPGE